MPLGILEPKGVEHVPGTVNVFEENQAREHVQPNTGLKYDTSGPKPIILVPQPSDDPNDPLNWPKWRRDFILFILSLLAVIITSLSPILAATTLELSSYFQKPLTEVALLTGWHLLGVGIAGFIFVPSSRIWGKRHAFLIGNVFAIFSCAWAGAIHTRTNASYRSLLWARILQGVALAPFESLVNAVVGDLFFVHERGKRMALSNFCIFGGAFMTPVLVGKIADSISWQWTFNFVAIFSAALLPILFFCVPETAYRRAAHLNTDMGTTKRDPVAAEGNRSSSSESSSNSLPDGNYMRPSNGHAGKDEVTVSNDRPSTNTPVDSEKVAPSHDGNTPSKTPYLQTLKPWNGRKSDEKFWKLALRPFPLFLHPAITWGCFIQGTLIGWTVFLGIILAAVMMRPPLFFTEVETGYMYTGAFIGAFLGFILSGLLSDAIVNFMVRKNNGVYEPEFRLPLVALQLVLGCAGLYGFGITSADAVKYGWFWPDFFFALEVAGMVVGTVASATYVVDAHRNIAVEAFTCMMAFKNIFSYGLTWSAYNWLIKSDIQKPFMVIASVQAGICLLTIPMYIFGKRNRAFFSRYDILKILHLW